MSWHIHSYNSSVFDSDAYGTDTESPVSAAEIIDDALKLKDEINIADSIRDFIRETAEDYFNTSGWDEEWWDAWEDKFKELM